MTYCYYTHVNVIGLPMYCVHHLDPKPIDSSNTIVSEFNCQQKKKEVRNKRFGRKK